MIFEMVLAVCKRSFEELRRGNDRRRSLDRNDHYSDYLVFEFLLGEMKSRSLNESVRLEMFALGTSFAKFCFGLKFRALARGNVGLGTSI